MTLIVMHCIVLFLNHLNEHAVLLIEFSTLLQLLLNASLFPCYSLELDRIASRELQIGFPQLPLFAAKTLLNKNKTIKTKTSC